MYQRWIIKLDENQRELDNQIEFDKNSYGMLKIQTTSFNDALYA